MKCDRKTYHSFYHGKFVTLSMAVACLFPFSSSEAHAQMNAACSQTLSFGTLAHGPAGGKLRVRPDGNVTDYTAVVEIGGAQNAICKITNLTNTTGTLELKVTATAADLVSGLNKINIKNFNLRTNSGGTKETITNLAITKKTVTFNVGATAYIDPAEVDGSYAGSIRIQAIYTF